MNPSILVTPNSKKAGKLDSIIPTDGTGDLDVVRATTATYLGSDGLIKTALANEPRFDYSNGSCPSILVEPQRTNLSLQSDMFSSDTWNKINATISANTIISPVGLQDAYTLIANGINNIHFTSQNILVNAGKTYTISYFLKKGTNNFAQVTGGSSPFGTDVWANFDLENGLIGSIGSLTTAKIENYGDGWYRCSITGNAISNSNINTIGVVIISNLSSIRAELNSLSTSVYVYGSQLEQGSNATSYIPTTTTSVTRNADVISKSGISDLIGQTEGTFYAEIYYQRLTTDFGVTALMIINTDGNFQNRIQLAIDQTHKLAAIFTNSSMGQNVVASSTNIQKGVHKLALKYTTTECKLFLDGVLVQTTALTIFPVATLGVLKIGNNFSNATPINNGVKIATIYNELLTDAECIELTTL